MMLIKEFETKDSAFPVRAVLYEDPSVTPKACILYFHGGGLLYGNAKDLPSSHLRKLTSAGYPVASFEYPLAPAAKLDRILASVTDSINHYLRHFEQYVPKKVPYVLFGRSAGAYLCLIAAAHGNLDEKPAGILSYYGYGFLCDNWFETPSSYYRALPAVTESCLQAIPQEIHTSGDLDTHYSVYVYARQTGNWKSLIYEGREKFFYLDYSLRTCDSLSCPLFAAHSTGDPDVPYEEFTALCNKYQPVRFITAGNVHDFDRDEEAPETARLLEETVKFLDTVIES
nr:alpha/beta hydrolase [uncultured Sellimonas sp.]